MKLEESYFLRILSPHIWYDLLHKHRLEYNSFAQTNNFEMFHTIWLGTHSKIGDFMIIMAFVSIKPENACYFQRIWQLCSHSYVEFVCR